MIPTEAVPAPSDQPQVPGSALRGPGAPALVAQWFGCGLLAAGWAIFCHAIFGPGVASLLVAMAGGAGIAALDRWVRARL